MTFDETVRAIQFTYPRIYFACHTRHQRARTGAAHVSQRDGAILVHLDVATPTGLTDLARHLSLARSTLSEALSRLEQHGFVTKTSGPAADRRSVGIRLTAKGIAAVQRGSVLETARLERVVRKLTESERRIVHRGLTLLAAACRDETDEIKEST